MSPAAKLAALRTLRSYLSTIQAFRHDADAAAYLEATLLAAEAPLRPTGPLAAVNDAGRVIGEGHHCAKLSDADVDLIIALRATGMSYGAIAAKFDDHVPPISKSTVFDICSGRRRAQTVAGHRPGAYRPTVASADEFEACA